MARRKGEDTKAAKRRRMPYVAKIKREDPFRPEDAREVECACRRVAAAGEFMVLAGWREESGYRLYHFTTWAKARAMQHWIDRSGIAGRPMPKLGLSVEELAERRRQALAWGLGTGAARTVTQAYAQARRNGDADLTAFNAACTVAKELGRPNAEVEHTVRALLDWAAKAHPDWIAPPSSASDSCSDFHRATALKAF